MLLSADTAMIFVAYGEENGRSGRDTWQAFEVPLGEEAERYVVRVLQGGDLRAEYSVAQPSFLYAMAMRQADLQPGPYRIEVAQVSSQYGPGPYRSIELFN